MSIIEALVYAGQGHAVLNRKGERLTIRDGYCYIGEGSFPLQVSDLLADYDLEDGVGEAQEQDSGIRRAQLFRRVCR